MKQLANSSHIFKTELKACSYKHNPGVYIYTTGRRASLLEWKNRGTGSHRGLIFNKAVQLCPNHSAGGSSAPKEGTPGLGWGRCSSSPQREGPCSWAADESCVADRGPSAGVRCYCVSRGALHHRGVTSSDYCFIQSSLHCPGLYTHTFSFFMRIWVRLCTWISSLFSMLPLRVFFLFSRVGVTALLGELALWEVILLVFPDDHSTILLLKWFY